MSWVSCIHSWILVFREDLYHGIEFSFKIILIGYYSNFYGDMHQCLLWWWYLPLVSFGISFYPRHHYAILLFKGCSKLMTLCQPFFSYLKNPCQPSLCQFVLSFHIMFCLLCNCGRTHHFLLLDWFPPINCNTFLSRVYLQISSTMDLANIHPHTLILGK